MRRFVGYASALLTMFAGGTAMAGVVITAESQSESKPAHPTSIFLEPDRLRQSASETEMIYRADLKKVWMINQSEHKYREMNSETMQAMRSRMDAAMQQMRQQMQSMPEAQRKQIEAMMAQRGMSGQAEPVSYEKAGSAKKIGAWSCTPYRVHGGAVEHEEVCLARMSDVGLKRDDLKAFESFSAFMTQMLPAGQARSRPLGADLDGLSKAVGYDAMPIQTTNFGDDGKPEYQMTVKQIERKTIPATMFEVPAGFVQEETRHAAPHDEAR
jgi:hypothetical protein